MKVDITVIGESVDHRKEIDDGSHVAGLLREESCTAVTIERWDGYSFRYEAAK